MRSTGLLILQGLCLVTHAQWSAPLRIDAKSDGSPADIAFAPHVAWSPRGVVHVVYSGGVWQNDNPTTWECWYTARRGGVWFTPVPLSSNQISTRANGLCIGPDGRLHVVHEEAGEGIYYRESSDEGMTWSAPFRVGSTHAALVAVDPAGNVMVVYHRAFTSGETDFKVMARVRRSTGVWDAEVRVAPDVGYYQRPLNLNAGGTIQSPRFHLVFETEPSGSRMEAFHTIWTPEGGWRAPVNYSQTPEVNFNGEVVELGGNRLIGLWYQGPLKWRISETLGLTWGLSQDLDPITSGFGQRLPEGLPDGAGGVHLVYDEESQYNGNFDTVYYRRFDGTAFGPRERISTQRSSTAQIAMGHNELHVVYQMANGSGVYYAQRWLGTPPVPTTTLSPTITLTPTRTYTLTPTLTPTMTNTPRDTRTFTPTPPPGAIPSQSMVLW